MSAVDVVSHLVAIEGITCHAWNKDRTMIALCPNSNSVHIYKVDDVTAPKTKWTLLHDLTEHDQIVTGIDWGPETNRIVTASQDRNAYVWNLEQQGGTETWVPVLVILRICRGATAVRWNKEETKFAVGSGSCEVPICYYEEEHNWWVSKMEKGEKIHGSTVLDMDWHPTAPLLATASSDYTCRILGAYVKKLDKKASIANSPWQKEDGKMGLFEVLHEIKCSGWVHSVKWSPSGSTLAVACHDSTVHFLKATGPDSTLQTIKMSCLPFRSLMFMSDTTLVGAGHELNPRVFALEGDSWSMKGKLDPENVAEVKETSNAKAAFAMFNNQATKGTSETKTEDLPTKHQNSITELVPYNLSGDDVVGFTSSGMDGNIISWKYSSVSSAMSNLSLG